MRARPTAVIACALAAALAIASCSPAPSAPAATATGSASALAPAAGSAAIGDGTYAGRRIAATMSYLGADWLDRPDRAAREQPDRVLDALAIAPGASVADVGAGTGYFTLRLARRVGPTGTVYATDLQPEMLAMLSQRAAAAGLANIVARQATDRDAALAPASVDLILMVDVYHELADPAATVAQLRRALRPRGRLVLVEYRGEDPAVAIKPEHKMTLAQIRAELAGLGFTFVDSLEFLPDQRIVIFTATAN